MGRSHPNYAGLMPGDADMVDTEGLLASLRVLDLSGDDGDPVTRLLADLGADVLKVEPPGGSPSRTEPADAARHQPALRTAQREQAQHGARPVRPERPRPVDRTRRQRRHRRRQRDSRPGRGIRNLVRRLGRSVSAAGGVVGHRLRHDRGRVRRGGRPIRCCTHCRGRCRGRAPPRGHRYRRRTASRRPPPPCRPHGPRWSRITTDYVVGQAITSTSPGSRLS